MGKFMLTCVAVDFVCRYGALRACQKEHGNSDVHSVIKDKESCMLGNGYLTDEEKKYRP